MHARMGAAAKGLRLRPPAMTCEDVSHEGLCKGGTMPVRKRNDISYFTHKAVTCLGGVVYK